jgi:hypothetical protein
MSTNEENSNISLDKDESFNNCQGIKSIKITVKNNNYLLMRSHEVLKLLGVTRPTLTSYIKSGKIKGTKLSTGMYDYDEQSIYDFYG